MSATDLHQFERRIAYSRREPRDLPGQPFGYFAPTVFVKIFHKPPSSLLWKLSFSAFFFPSKESV
jgi:hypothetical protein